MLLLQEKCLEDCSWVLMCHLFVVQVLISVWHYLFRLCMCVFLKHSSPSSGHSGKVEKRLFIRKCISYQGLVYTFADTMIFFFHWSIVNLGAFFVAHLEKNLPAMWETWVQSLDWEDPWRRERLPTLAWRIPQTIWSMGSQRVRHNWATFTLGLPFWLSW